MRRLLLIELPKIFSDSLNVRFSPVKVFKKLVPKTCRVFFRVCFHTVSFVCIGNTFCNVIGNQKPKLIELLGGLSSSEKAFLFPTQ